MQAIYRARESGGKDGNGQTDKAPPALRGREQRGRNRKVQGLYIHYEAPSMQLLQGKGIPAMHEAG